MTPLEVSKSIYEWLVAVAGEPAPAMRAWDGTTWGDPAAGATIVLQHPGALRSMLWPPGDLTAGEAYVFDDVDFEGEMLLVLDFGRRLEPLVHQKRKALGVVRLLRQLPDESRRPDRRPMFRGRLHSRARDKAAVSAHYDTGNEFFQTFLDPLMVYSCAYFLDPNETLEAAQRRKLDVICRKLQLQSGMQFLDIGCGWGSLIIHAAINYGVEALGVTISREQAELARRRIKEAGVEGRVTILESDYRDVTGTFDAVASVGMFEHVGGRQLGSYFGHMRELLAPSGAFLNHGITTRDRSHSRRRPSFVNTYVFPDGELVPVEKVIEVAEKAGFEVRDAESLRMSYGRTLRHWVANLEENADLAAGLSSEQTYRIWRLYMAGSVVAFETGGISIYQLLLAGINRPWTFGRKRLLAEDD